MRDIRVKAILVTAVLGLIAACCLGFVSPSSASASVSQTAYVRGLGTDDWKAIIYKDATIAAGVVTISTVTGATYVTSIHNVVIERY